MGRRVVVTGMGIVSPIGIGKEAFWQSLIEGKSGIAHITHFDASTYPCQIGGEVKDLSYRNLIDPRKLRTTTHVTQLALAAAKLALDDANLEPHHYSPSRIGVIFGTALGGYKEVAEQQSILLERGASRINPLVANSTYSHATALEIAQQIGAQGMNFVISSSCTSSLEAIGHAADLIREGVIDVCISGGAESPLFPLVFASMSKMWQLSTSNDNPPSACRPFDSKHDGMVLSEGGCIFILESQDHARKRGGKVYCEILGHGCACDAYRTFAIEPSGDVVVHAIRQALDGSHLTPRDIQYVSAHGSSSPQLDRRETLIMKKAFADSAHTLPLSSIKAVLGHAMGTSGAFQVASAALSFYHNLLPPTHNLEEPDPECDLDYIPNIPRAARHQNCLISNFAYGGMSSFLVVKRPEAFLPH